MKKTTVLIMGLGILGLLFSLSFGTTDVFESLESKTETGLPVFNQIHFSPGWKKDVWLMRQTHHGSQEAPAEWDQLAIVVDKSRNPAEATFYQLPSGGDLRFEDHPIPFKARCFACHANGPRAVRPVTTSSFADRIKVAIWNIRIKAYGHVDSKAGADFAAGAHFKSEHKIFSRPLGLKTCEKCHAENGIRNELKLEHVGTAYFLVKTGIMPPFPFRATAEELATLEKYNR